MQSVMACLLLLLLTLPSPACINIDGTTLDGHAGQEIDWLTAHRLQAAMNQTPKEKLLQYRRNRLPSTDDPFADREFEAVSQVLTGDIRLGIEGLLALEVESPGRYTTATNLGTAYELAGDNEKALTWISEGVRRNPNSHDGSEWLHEYILLTKIRLATQPDLFQQERMFILPDTFSESTQIDVHGVRRRIDDISQAIRYQLTERMLFVKPTDLVVAELLFTYAQIEAQIRIVESAMIALDLSRQYGFVDLAMLDVNKTRYQAAIEIHQKAKAAERFRDNLLKGLAVVGVVLWAVIFGWLVYRRQQKRRKSANNIPE